MHKENCYKWKRLAAYLCGLEKEPIAISGKPLATHAGLQRTA